ncbi:hypothetical protein TTHERM_00059500 (macronuclear) [Tetrahymena thermophila SB210]|uniref:Uncharacterized protein n=1 Tax=Tetrahymena thermophila (strain SB210) TaxID=312017 RepID=I7LTW9_TETTS|nr:hypothetical protein TTHERM_00059500 [Tetrahymena thermophila SB210]EAR87437.1 hypothetical protein TTHERM_00059500 [Tetrahymena thermophila SB210]|eukprot:XP_001007682.1 hypothetical protein TTHERM_00059500 [Tetrahymena thermophila SB210]
MEQVFKSPIITSKTDFDNEPNVPQTEEDTQTPIFLYKNTLFSEQNKILSSNILASANYP